jgi:hypothetical protein
VHVSAAAVVGLLVGVAAANGGDSSSSKADTKAAAVATQLPSPTPATSAGVARLRIVVSVERGRLQAALRTDARQRQALVAARSATRRAQHARAVAVASEHRAKQHAASEGGGGSTSTQVSCTLTSTGKCIQGGEFCAAAEDGQDGFDANGTEYVCRNGHWENL